ncbi:uncharacterized protein in vnfD 5'region-like [Planococcus citri]|uniref:uncharacterized protein in vnfD 5'region-like n=1 Tax=Planococcus citri TaxID=170843 RepID=UPI0031F792EC
MIRNKMIKIFTILFLCLYFSPAIIWAEDSKSAIPPLQKLPALTSDFETIRSENYVYVDKTAFIEKILDFPEPSFFLLTRPRRFGKSVFLEMLSHFFSADKHLFNDTYIAKRKPEDWTKYPIINLDFIYGKSIRSSADIKDYENDLEETLCGIGADYGLDCSSSNSIDKLIKNLSTKYGQRVVILIDEYDSIFRTVNVKDGDLFNEFKKVAGQFYQKMKQSGEDIKLVYITGISRLALSFFEIGLSQSTVTDLTFHKDFSSAIGFTLDEINLNYWPYLQRWASHYGVNVSNIAEELTRWYDGYRFSLQDSETRVFNTLAVICSFKELKIRNYWAESSKIEAIIERFTLSKQNVDEFYYYSIKAEDAKRLYEDEFSSHVQMPVLLYNSGYLTIRKYNEKSDTIILSYPNKEIENKFVEKLFDSPFKPSYGHAMNTSIRESDMESFIDFLNKAAFRKYDLSTVIPETNEIEVTKHIMDAVINNKLGAVYAMKIMNGQTKGDAGIHLQNEDTSEVFPADVALIIEVKFRQSAITAIHQLFECAVKDPAAFRQTINKFLKKDVPTYSHLLAMNVGQRTGEYPEIQEWIAVPYRDGRIFMNEIQGKVNSGDELKNVEDGWCQKMKSWSSEKREFEKQVVVRNDVSHFRQSTRKYDY